MADVDIKRVRTALLERIKRGVNIHLDDSKLFSENIFSTTSECLKLYVPC